MQYLDTVKNEWFEARQLHDYYRHFAAFLELELEDGNIARIDPGRHPLNVVVRITDIDSNDTITTWRELTFADLSEETSRSTSVDELVRGLRDCGGDVHTRLIVLGTGKDEPRGFRLARDLLFGHLLSVELGLQPADVLALMAQAFRQIMPYFSSDIDIMKLGFNRTTTADVACCILGKREIQGTAVEHGKYAYA